MLVGEGPNLLRLEAKAVDLGVEKEVLFLGHRDDVARLYQAFDMMAMPSRFDGLGMAAVEAQAAGLPCLLSSAFPKEAALTEEVSFLPPEDPDLWAERLLDTLENLPERGDTRADITRAGHELTDAAEALTRRFEQLMQEKPSFKRRFLLTGACHEDDLACKARQDVQRIAAEAGYVALTAPEENTVGKPWQRAASLGRVTLEWGRLFFKLHHGDLLLAQYPFCTPQSASIAKYALHMLQWKGAKTAAYVHELRSLRDLPDDSFRWSDQELLPRFDRVIAQTPRMADYLTGQGVRAENLLWVQLFDHLSNAPIPERKPNQGVCVAGDLRRKRSAYLHDLPRLKSLWHLYGAGWKGKKADLIWHGESFDDLEGSFGLVWAGANRLVCTGAQGAYMMLAAPRQLSLYLSQGLPVIVWKWSAMAEFVRENEIGLVIDSLTEVPLTVSSLSAAEYAALAANARAWGEKIRRGGMTRAVLDKLG